MKIIDAREVTTSAMVAGNEKRFHTIVHKGRRKEWVGFGWVDEGPATQEDYSTLHVVKDGKGRATLWVTNGCRPSYVAGSE